MPWKACLMVVANVSQYELENIDGIKLASCAAGIKYSGRKDLSIIEISEGASISAVFTTNAFCAAPVTVAKAHLSSRDVNQKSYLLINSGNANAGTGQQGLNDANECCHLLAEHFSVETKQVLPFSTGVIGETLPMEKITSGLKYFSESGVGGSWFDVSNAILTTDTRPKTRSIQLKLSEQTISFTGIAKGSGMIKPDMATMLAYIATDAKIEQGLLDEMLVIAANDLLTVLVLMVILQQTMHL